MDTPHMRRSEEDSLEEELKSKLSNSIKTYNSFITAASTDRERKRFMPDGDRILIEIMHERKFKIFHFTEAFSNKLEFLIADLMKEVKHI